MAENLLIHTGNKEEKYRELLPQLQALVSSETNRIANLANIAAALKQTFPENAKELFAIGSKEAVKRYEKYKKMAQDD